MPQPHNMTVKQMHKQILDIAGESDWDVEETLKICFLPYLNRTQLEKIVTEHFPEDDDE